MRGREADARKSLARLTGFDSNSPDLQADMDEIKVNLEAEKALGASSYLDCFRPSQNKIFFRTLSGIFIQAWQQLTGSMFSVCCVGHQENSAISFCSQLHHVLRNHLFRTLWNFESFPRYCRNKYCQRIYDTAWHVRC